MGSVSDAKIRAAYVNTQESVPIQIFFIDINQPQSSILIQVDKSTAVGFSKKNQENNIQINRHDIIFATGPKRTRKLSNILVARQR